MSGEFEAKFAQMQVDASCPPAFVQWLKKQGITTIETYGRLASNEDKLDAKVAEVFVADGGKFDNVG